MFRLLLPAAADHAAKTPAAVVGDVVAYRGGGRVLVVDDEESVRLVAARMLESLGFSVEQANDGREGVAKFAADPAAYVLVILDLTMPHLNGADAFREMRGMRPEVRVVLMSGYGEHEAISGLVDQGLAGYVHKPFNQARFTAAIRKCLEG
jgi:DNA-binding NtrC family response regulator